MKAQPSPAKPVGGTQQPKPAAPTAPGGLKLKPEYLAYAAAAALALFVVLRGKSSSNGGTRIISAAPATLDSSSSDITSLGDNLSRTIQDGFSRQLPTKTPGGTGWGEWNPPTTQPVGGKLVPGLDDANDPLITPPEDLTPTDPTATTPTERERLIGMMESGQAPDGPVYVARPFARDPNTGGTLYDPAGNPVLANSAMWND